MSYLDVLANASGRTIVALKETAPLETIDILSNAAGTVTAVLIPDAGTEAYGDFMALLGAARIYYAEHTAGSSHDARVAVLINRLIVEV